MWRIGKTKQRVNINSMTFYGDLRAYGDTLHRIHYSLEIMLKQNTDGTSESVQTILVDFRLN